MKPSIDLGIAVSILKKPAIDQFFISCRCQGQFTNTTTANNQPCSTNVSDKIALSQQTNGI